VKLFYTGPAINAEMLEVMLEKQEIKSELKPLSAEVEDADDLNRQIQVFVPEKDFERAWQLFYAEREDEL
jgi:hypothetical protein